MSLDQRSLNNLKGVHPDLCKLMDAVSAVVPVTITEGVRDIKRQRFLFENGLSKTLDSKHLVQPDGYGHATDVYMKPIDVNDLKKAAFLAGVIRAMAHSLGIKIRQGIDWDMDADFKDQKFHDLPHTELIL